MLPRAPLVRGGAGILALVFCIAAAASACSSSTTTTDPSPPKCQVTLTNSVSSAVDSGGGSGTVTVDAAAECAWSASADPWITITSSTSGQGHGTVEYHVAANPDSTPRHGTIKVNGQSVGIDQAAASCSYALTPPPQIPASGGTGTVGVATGSSCAWTATSNADWITITSGQSGTGNGNVGFTAAPNQGNGRSGTITIGGQIVTISQAASPNANCTFTLSAASQNVDAPGGTVTVGVATTASCQWTATSTVSWMTVTGGATGTGNGTVTLSVGANSGGARMGTVTIAGQAFTVSQAAQSSGGGCSYVVSPQTVQVPNSGGTGPPIAVQTPLECPWSSAINAGYPWITSIQGSGSGPGHVTFSVAANSGAARTGAITVAGQTVTITQGDGCSPSIASSSQNIGSGGGPGGPVTVTAGSGCGWTAASNVSWITGVNPASGSGNGSVTFMVAANPGPARNGTLTIAGHTFTVMQASGCTYGISPSSQSFPLSGSNGGPINVTTGPGCGWMASNPPPWVSNIMPAGMVTGPGTLTFSVGANGSCNVRTGTITIATQTLNLSQDGFSFSPASQSVPKAGQTGLGVDVSTGSTCTWTAAFDGAPPWIHITAGGGLHTGNAHIMYTVDPNPGSTPRTATMTLGGAHFTVTQLGT